jgi:hypothetical protein
VYPQEGASRRPFGDDPALKEPRCRSVVLSLSHNIVICGWIGGKEPGSEELFPLVPYEDV